MVSALDSGASGLGSSPGRGHCTVFLGKTLYPHRTGKLNARLTLLWTGIPSRGEQKYYYSLHATETGISSALICQMGFTFLTCQLVIEGFIFNFRFVNGMVYYGLSMSSGEFGGSIFLNFVLTSLAEIPGNVLVVDNCNRCRLYYIKT